MPTTATTESAHSDLFRELALGKVSMLSVSGSDLAAEPMIHHVDADKAQLSYLTRRGAALAKAVGRGQSADVTFMSLGTGFFASLQGHIAPGGDRHAIEMLWAPAMEQSFPLGPDDPDIRLLQFAPHKAALWATVQDVPQPSPLPESIAAAPGAEVPRMCVHCVVPFERSHHIERFNRRETHENHRDDRTHRPQARRA
ncbi:MAG: pyridoxamine 5'-phosphate oxidase family protein [Pseudomonadota bacterium]